MPASLSYRDVYSPFFVLEADGALAQDIVRYVTRFEYTDSRKKGDELKIEVANPGHIFTDDKRFAQGVRFRVRWGYASDVSLVRQCVIARARPNFKANTITLIAFDLRLEMNRGSKAKNWGNVSSSFIAQEIAKRYGFQTDITPSDDARRQSRVQPANLTDIQYLNKLADKLGWDSYVEGRTLHFHPVRFSQPSAFTFRYFNGSNPMIIEFEPTVKMNKPSKSGVVAANPKDGSASEASSSSKDKRESPDGFTGQFAIDTERGVGEYIDAGQNPGLPWLGIGEQPRDFGVLPRAPGVGVVASSTPETDPKVVKKEGLAKQGKVDMTANEATLVVVGTPKLRARQMITLEDVGGVYSGKWYVVESRHIIQASSQSYVVNCTISRNAQKKGTDKQKNESNGKEEKDTQDGSGLDPGYVFETYSGRWLPPGFGT